MKPTEKIVVWAFVVPKTVQDDEDVIMVHSRYLRSGCHVRNVNHGMLNSICEIWGKWDHPQRSSLHNYMEGIMRTKSWFTLGFM